MAVKEIRDIITAFEHAQKAGKTAALATVVHTDGSSYRRPGARMLVTDTGELTGAISGGCLEGDALEKALFAISRHRSMLVTYDTTDEDDARFGVQLGCNGIIQVLFEPIDPADPKNPIELLKTMALERQDAVLVTLFSLKHKRSPQPGTCLLLQKGEISSREIDTGDLGEILRHDALMSLSQKTSFFRHYVSPTHDMTAFIEYVSPPVSVVVIGAGNDVIPLVKMADVLGWKTTVVDGRPQLARPQRFVPSCQVLISKAEKLLEQISVDDHTVVLLMTHNYNYDLAVLKALLPLRLAYIGSLGPRAKLERMLGEIREAGITVSEEQLDHIYGPSGLEIGAETPEEIALSILAEIKAVLTRKAGGSLRENQHVIHARNETRIEEVTLPYYHQRTNNA